MSTRLRLKSDVCQSTVSAKDGREFTRLNKDDASGDAGDKS